MNPYTFSRTWHLPSAYDSGTCERNYPAMYPTTWHPSYFPSSSVYPFQTDSAAAASAVAAKNSSASGDWKLQGVCSPTPDGNVGLNARSLENGGKSGYEGLLYKPAMTPNGRSLTDYDGAAAAREEAAQRSCCAISCSCSTSTSCGVGQGSRLSGMLDGGSCGGPAWRSAPDMSPLGHDFKPNVGAAHISPYQSHNGSGARCSMQ